MREDSSLVGERVLECFTFQGRDTMKCKDKNVRNKEWDTCYCADTHCTEWLREAIDKREDAAKG